MLFRVRESLQDFYKKGGTATRKNVKKEERDAIQGREKYTQKTTGIFFKKRA